MRHLLLVLAAWAVLGGCILIPTREEIVENRISIQVTDSVMFYDETTVVLFRAGTLDTFLVAWTGYLDSASRLLDIRPPGYRGEAVDVLIESTRGGLRGLRIFAAWNPGKRRHEVTLLTPDPDTVRPAIQLYATGFFFLVGEPYRDPSRNCVDNFDRVIWTTTVEGTVDTGMPGEYPIAVRCVDRGGNEARLPLMVKVIPRPTRIPALADS